MSKPWETDDTRMAESNLMACAYNAAVNSNTPRGIRKMADLIRAINLEERTRGAAKLAYLVKVGIIESFTMCPPECEVRPGGLFHAKDCENEMNHPTYRARMEKARHELPPKQGGEWAASVGLVGGA